MIELIAFCFIITEQIVSTSHSQNNKQLQLTRNALDLPAANFSSSGPSLPSLTKRRPALL